MRLGGSKGTMGGTRSEVRYFNFSLLCDKVGTRAQKVHEKGTRIAREGTRGALMGTKEDMVFLILGHGHGR